MFFVVHTSSSKFSKKQNIAINFEPQDIPKENTVDDSAHYPFDLALELGNTQLKVYLNAGELNCMIQQGLALLQEYDRHLINRSL